MRYEVYNNEFRTWPAPERSWFAKQVWSDLIFISFPVDKSLLQNHLPKGLKLDLFNKTAYISLVPFSSSKTSIKLVPEAITSAEVVGLNVRTYVKVDDKPGVYFFSINMSSLLVSQLIKRKFYFNGCNAKVKHVRNDDFQSYNCQRNNGDNTERFSCSYKPYGVTYQAESGSIEAWLIERFCAYSVNHSGKLYRTEIMHNPYVLQKVNVQILEDTISDFSRKLAPPLFHYCSLQESVMWSKEKVK